MAEFLRAVVPTTNDELVDMLVQGGHLDDPGASNNADSEVGGAGRGHGVTEGVAGGGAGAAAASADGAASESHAARLVRAFRRVDRGLFAPPGSGRAAYFDRPLRDPETGIHLSAPSMYASVLRTLSLDEDPPNGQALSFLNLGSGSGYLSHIVGAVLGPDAQIWSVEVRGRIVRHARCAAAFFAAADSGQPKMPRIATMRGDALRLARHAEGNPLVDRIYVGAEAPLSLLDTLTSLLAVGGVLVGPFEGRLMRVVRRDDGTLSQHVLAHVAYAPLLRPGQYDESAEARLEVADDDEDTEETAEDVASDTYVGPPGPLMLYRPVWSPEPEEHAHWPPAFRQAALALLVLQRRGPDPAVGGGLPGLLPAEVWHYILTFCSREWFDVPPSREAILERLLAAETKSRIEAEKRAEEAEKTARSASLSNLILREQLRASRSTCEALREALREAGLPEPEDANDNNALAFLQMMMGRATGAGGVGDDDDEADDGEASDGELHGARGGAAETSDGGETSGPRSAPPPPPPAPPADG